MRRVDFLISKIRFKTNNSDVNRFSDKNILELMNECQAHLQDVIFPFNADCDIFNKDFLIDVVTDTESYDLPSDIYAGNSINSVNIAYNSSQVSNSAYTPLRHLTSKERASGLGYTLIENKLHLTLKPKVTLASGIRLNYAYTLPTLAVRSGEISSVDSGLGTIVLAVGAEEDLTNYDDFFSIVDSNGLILHNELSLDSYDNGTRTITTSSDLTGVTSGYIVLGKNATTHSKLPNHCERVLCKMTERAIQVVDSSGDFNVSNLLTQEEIDTIITVYKDNKGDVSYPPITNTTYLL